MPTRTVATYDKGALVTTRQEEIPAEDANREDLQGKALAALTANAAFLAITSPTNAQILAQVRLLTRENSAVIRLVLGRLEDTAGT